jgi:magnesium transporter
MEVYLSSVSNRLNEIMKVLTIISAIFIPLTFIAGVYGMNFHTESSPWNMPELKAYYGYPVCMAIMLFIGIVQVYYFKRKGWLRNEEKAVTLPVENLSSLESEAKPDANSTPNVPPVN